jgi:phosphohistidine phosphatase SixA
MKPKNIVLVRHGQSEGNVNKEIYKTKPDYALRLTPTGIEQALQAGNILYERLGKTLPQFYISPFWRTRDTYYYVRKAGRVRNARTRLFILAKRAYFDILLLQKLLKHYRKLRKLYE